MRTLPLRLAMSSLVFLSFLSLAGCQHLMRGKDDFYTSGGVLYKGDKEFKLQGFVTPGLGDSAGSLDRIVPPMVRVAEVGGNTLCFDLAGFNGDGSALDPVGIQSVDALAYRAKDARMGIIVRVLGDNTDPKFRKRAVKTAAKALRGQGMAVYWIDGPDAAELAKSFKKTAPNLVVLAEANGDVRVTDAPPAEPPAEATLVRGTLPDLNMPNVHFLLPGRDEDYPALDAALMNEVERTPWTPDNSMLSAEEQAEGFVSLFDGKSLANWWIKDENKESFQASEDGFIEWRSGGGGALMSRERYDNFVLRLDWKILPGGNSGVWLRAPRAARQSKIGFEFQMQGDSDVPEITKTSTGSIYDVIPPLSMAAKKEGLWNSLEVTCNGPHVKAVLNGQLVQDLNFDETDELRHRLRKGFICLTDHDNYVAFRNIRIKKL